MARPAEFCSTDSNTRKPRVALRGHGMTIIFRNADIWSVTRERALPREAKTYSLGALNEIKADESLFGPGIKFLIRWRIENTVTTFSVSWVRKGSAKQPIAPFNAPCMRPF